jgi:hypothetical protein
MAAAVLARSYKMQRPGSSICDNHIELIPMPLLPDKKEWVAEYDLEMLMLDGYVRIQCCSILCTNVVLVALALEIMNMGA